MIEQKTLYIVATPIGNLQDITLRAIEVLRHVDLIVAEDTRHSRQLLQQFAITTPLQALHQHNEQAKAEQILLELQRGRSIALISDAGTPTISDPGYRCVQAVTQAGLNVKPIPGVCAIIAALSVAGMPADKFIFHGFLSTRPQQRYQNLQLLAQATETIVLYEAPHRVLELLRTLPTIFGSEREVMIGRELSKYFESFYRGTSAEILAHFNAHSDEVCGEFVVCIAGNPTPMKALAIAADNVLKCLMTELPLNKAAKLAAEITGLARNQLYQRGLMLQNVK